ncbi:hypothetical protein [Microbacterium sp. 179-I 3D4 NHS]|uniref:hypothetical protein n=1 Tax=Microbacterium sp. 179-I 3D4 NHS TaxID=3142381 RepID=UPI0039A261FE
MSGALSLPVRAATAVVILASLFGVTGCVTLAIDRDVAAEDARSASDADPAPDEPDGSDTNAGDEDRTEGGTGDDSDAGAPADLPGRLSFEAGASLPDGLEVALGSSFSSDPEWSPESDPNVTVFTHAPTECWVGFTSAEYSATAEEDLLATRNFLETELGFFIDPAYESYPLFPFDPSGEKGGDPWGTMEFLTYAWDDATVPSYGYTSARVIAAAHRVIVVDVACPTVDALDAEFAELTSRFSIGLIPAGLSGS